VPTKISALAKATGMSQASVYAYLSGSTVPPARALDDLLLALGVQRPDDRRRWGQLRDDTEIARKRVRRDAKTTPITPPPVVHNLPEKATVFVGRDLARLTRVVGTYGQVAIHGEGGIGKTELALQFAHALCEPGRLRAAWWIDGGSPREITAGLAALARRLLPDAPRRDAAAADSAMSWLRSNPQWLVILDNVNSLEHVAEMLSELRDCGSVVLTTRLDPAKAEWRRNGLQPLRLRALDRKDSVALLLARTDSGDREGADLLAAEAGDLPLALSQAAALIARHPETGFREYRRQLADELDGIASTNIDGGSGWTIAATWSIAMHRARADAPLSAEIVSVLSYLAGTPLPEQAFDVYGTPENVARALDSLTAYRVIDRDANGITAHRLVLAAARAADQRAAEHRAAAVALLERAIPEDPLVNAAEWPQWRMLTAHIEALTARLPATEQTAASIGLRERFATFLQGQGNVSRAIALLETVVSDAERILGRQHTDTRDYTANLALAYVAAARIGPALVVLEDLVPRYEEAVGPHDVETLMMRAVLANAYRLRGHPELAARLYEQVIAEAEGTDLDIATARTELAAAYTDAGRLEAAITLLEQVYAQQSSTLGDQNPMTLVSRHNLARARREAGQVDEALAEFRKVLAIQSEVLGTKNPHTLATRGNLALTEQARGRIDDAIAQFEALLLHTQEVLGREHPTTLTTLRYLANAHLANGEPDEAIPLLQRAVLEHRRLLGPDEPLTFLARRDLAAAYREASAAVYDALSRDQEKVLGPDHRETDPTRGRP
jgi:tetratricopeptide (TPR) repeat protein